MRQADKRRSAGIRCALSSVIPVIREWQFEGHLMSTSPIILSPKPIAAELFTDAAAAVAYVEEIYERNTEFLRNLFEAYGKSERIVGRVRATYPFVRVTATSYAPRDSRLSYGFVAEPGVHETTVTRPNLFRAYLTEQIGLLIENHGVAVVSANRRNQFRCTSPIGATSISKPASPCAAR